MTAVIINFLLQLAIAASLNFSFSFNMAVFSVSKQNIDHTYDQQWYSSVCVYVCVCTCVRVCVCAHQLSITE